jgi:hypothetical protein
VGGGPAAVPAVTTIEGHSASPSPGTVATTRISSMRNSAARSATATRPCASAVNRAYGVNRSNWVAENAATIAPAAGRPSCVFTKHRIVDRVSVAASDDGGGDSSTKGAADTGREPAGAEDGPPSGRAASASAAAPRPRAERFDACSAPRTPSSRHATTETSTRTTAAKRTRMARSLIVGPAVRRLRRGAHRRHSLIRSATSDAFTAISCRTSVSVGPTVKRCGAPSPDADRELPSLCDR